GSDFLVYLGPLAGEDEQLLAVVPQRLVEPLLDLIGRVDVGPVGGEGAVLAVALAGARERQRVVARESDPTHTRDASARLAEASRAESSDADQLAVREALALSPWPGGGGTTCSPASITKRKRIAPIRAATSGPRMYG